MLMLLLFQSIFQLLFSASEMLWSRCFCIWLWQLTLIIRCCMVQLVNSPHSHHIISVCHCVSSATPCSLSCWSHGCCCTDARASVHLTVTLLILIKGKITLGSWWARNISVISVSLMLYVCCTSLYCGCGWGGTTGSHTITMLRWRGLRPWAVPDIKSSISPTLVT